MQAAGKTPTFPSDSFRILTLCVYFVAAVVNVMTDLKMNAQTHLPSSEQLLLSNLSPCVCETSMQMRCK